MEKGNIESSKCHRVIGFWNAADKQYHWYVINLQVPAIAIYSLYRIRWQIELIFKGCKRSLNVDEKVTSNNDNIIESLVLSTGCSRDIMYKLTGRTILTYFPPK